MNKIWILAVAGIISNLFDAVTTFFALQYTHVYEANPFMAFFYSRPLIGYPLKLILGTWIFLPLKYCPSYYTKNKKLIMAVWVVLILMYIAVGVRNIFKII